MTKVIDFLCGLLFAVGVFFCALGVMCATGWLADHITLACLN